MSMAHRMNAVRVQAKREFRSTMHGLGIYAMLSLVFLGVSQFMFRTTLFDITEPGIVALSNPISGPFYVAAGIASAYLGLMAALSISRERDQGTIEVLFYGPVDSWSYIIGKYVQQMIAFVVVLAFSMVNFFWISSATNLGLTNVLGLLVLSLFLASSMVAFGIFLSALTNRMAVSTILYLGLMLFFLAFAFVHGYLQSLTIFEGRELNPLLIYVRSLVENMKFGLDWISPLAYYNRGEVALGMGDTGQYILSLVSSVVYTAVMLVLAVFGFNRKGVRR